MPHWRRVLRPGHSLQLLQGGAELFPAMVQAIDSAVQEVRLETYIFDFTASGAEVAWALERAARRGVTVQVLVDGFGSPPVPAAWSERLALAGVQWEVFSPPSRFVLLARRQWRRLHRKLCVVDGRVGFCGGINILDDFFDPRYGVLPEPRLDYGLQVTGPLVAEMRETMARQWQRQMLVRGLRATTLMGAFETWRSHASIRRPVPAAAPPPGGALKAGLLWRDNLRHRRSIGRAYRSAIGHARQEVIIANAYFVPGRRLRRALVEAAARGVRVCLLVQGRYEGFLQYYASRTVFGALLRAGIEIHEYSPSFLHAKVAVIDGHWATVGSSNLDPLSMLLAREANVVVEDQGFAQELRARLLGAIEAHGERIDPASYERRSLRQRAKEWLALALMRLALLFQGKEYL